MTKFAKTDLIETGFTLCCDLDSNNARLAHKNNTHTHTNNKHIEKPVFQNRIIINYKELPLNNGLKANIVLQ